MWVQKKQVDFDGIYAEQPTNPNLEEIKTDLKKVCDLLFKTVKVPNLAEKCYIAGGAIASLILFDEPNDYDFYFTDSKSFDEVETYLKDNKIPIEIKTKNAITIILNYKKIQLIKKVFGTPYHILRKFDYYHCMNFYRADRNELHIQEIDLIKNKQLLYNSSCEAPLGAVYRYHKFQSRGWEATKETLDILLRTVTNLKGIKLLICTDQLY